MSWSTLKRNKDYLWGLSSSDGHACFFLGDIFGGFAHLYTEGRTVIEAGNWERTLRKRICTLSHTSNDEKMKDCRSYNIIKL